MQILTPGQTQAIMKVAWEGVEKLLWFLSGLVGLAILHKLSGIKKTLTAIAAVPAQLTAHTKDDRDAFTAQKTIIEAQGQKTREEIQNAMKEHLRHYHPRPATGD